MRMLLPHLGAAGCGAEVPFLRVRGRPRGGLSGVDPGCCAVAVSMMSILTTVFGLFRLGLRWRRLYRQHPVIRPPDGPLRQAVSELLKNALACDLVSCSLAVIRLLLRDI